MLKTKKIITIIMIAILVLAVGVQVRATSDNPLTLNDLPLNGGDDDANAIAANEIAANEIAVNQEAANSQAVIQPTTNTTNNMGDNTLPQTGVTEDITVMFFIIVCVISAIYAYKKIRDYNV